MTGGSAAHVTIALNFAIALRQALRGTGRRPFGSDIKVIANGATRFQGDAAVSLSCIGIEISLDAIYEDTELDVTRRRGGEPQAPAL
jgi:hypothetical protein